ncbi:MAG: MerR family transcriptional regulator [Cucumibacter sp.]
MPDRRPFVTAGECARATGASVRALRHYERLGLVTPVRAGNGYRHYSADQVMRVVTIKLLQRLGMRLDAIARLLKSAGSDLARLMATQEQALEADRQRIDIALAYTKRARALLKRNPRLDLSDLMDILENSNMTKPPKAFEGLAMPELTEAQKRDLASRQFTRKDQEEVSARWTKVFAEAEALAGTDPKSPLARAMVAEARTLVEWFTGGDKGLSNHAGSMWQKAWADPERRKHMPVSAEGWEFLQRAMAALNA